MAHLNDKTFFKEIKKIGENYSNKIELQFPYFCLEIFPDLDLSNDEIEDALEGLERNDDGIDAFHIDEENSIIYFFQFKAVESEQSFRINTLKKESLDYLYNITKKLENQDYRENHKNNRIREIAELYLKAKKRGYEERFEYFQLGRNPNPNIEKSYPKLRYHDFETIKNEYLEYKSKLDLTEPPSIDIQLHHGKIEEKMGTNKRTFISLITGDELINLREEYRYRLFDKNLRFGLGSNQKINKEIIETSVGQPENFYFFNNGITIISSKFKYKETNQKIHIEYPQIINGAQTVNAIYAAYKQRKKDKEHFKKVLILFRIIQKQSDTDFELKVTKYNNSQNAIQARDFYANATEQIDLQRKLSKHGFFYEIKRGDRDYIKNNNHNFLKKKLKDFKHCAEKIDIIKLAGLWMAYYAQQPAGKMVGKESIFGKENNYDLLFKNKDFTDDFVKEMIFAYFIFSIVEQETKTYRGAKSILALTANEDFYKDEKTFEKANDKVQQSLIYNEITKKRFKNYKEKEDERASTLKEIKCYQPFASAKYLVTALVKAIIDKCDYLDNIVKYDLFENKEFIKNKIIGAWLNTILKKLIIPDFETSIEKRPSINYYYTNPGTYERLKEKFNSLDIKENKEFFEIFPLDLTNRN